MQDPIQEIMQCAVCLGQVNKPRVLPCFHSFCESCLTNHIRTTSNVSRHTFRKFLCPTCRESTNLPTKGVEGFPLDFRMNKFTDALKEVVSQKKKGICGICLTDENFQTAVKFCADCQKYFCSGCLTKHQVTPVLSNHLMLDLHQNVGSGPVCHSHSNEHAGYVCSTCLYPVCVICIMGKHRFHSISHLNVTNSLQRTELHRSLSLVREQIWSIHETLFHLTCLEGRLKGMYDESRLHIKRQSRKLISRILGDENLLLKDLEVIYDAKSSEVFKLREKCRDRLSTYEMLQSQVGTVLEAENIHELLLKYPSLNKELIKSKQSSSLEMPEKLLRFVKFKPGHPFKLGKLLEVNLQQESKKLAKRLESLNRDETERLGSLNVAQSEQSSTEEEELGSYLQPQLKSHLAEADVSAVSNDRDSEPQLPMHSYPYQDPLLQATIRNCDKSLGNICLPYNVCFTEEGSLIVAENGNRRLQVFDTNGKSLNIIANGDIIPRSVVVTPRGNIAVTDELTRTIKIYDLEGYAKTTLNPASATFPFGLAVTQTGQLVFTDMIFENVTIITTSGILKRQFGSHGFTEDRFDNPGYLAVDDQDRIFVSDSGNHAVKVFNIRGTYLFKFGSYGTCSGKLKYPKAICFDESGNIFVADAGNDRVVLFSPDGMFLGTVVDRALGLHRPTGLTYSSKGILAVAMPDLNEIRMFKLSRKEIHPNMRL